MITLVLQKFTDDGGQLRDPDDAAFLRDRKLKDGCKLDFSGVERVSARFLDALFEGLSPESLEGRILNQNPAVDEALAAWVDRCEEVPSAESQRPPPVRVTRPIPRPEPIPREAVHDNRFTPSRLAQRLREALRSYIESAYPLNDPILVESRRALFEEAEHGRLLAQEPFIETTTRYVSAQERYDQLGLPPRLGALLRQLSQPSAPGASAVLYPRMYEHQAQAFKSFFLGAKAGDSASKVADLGRGKDIIIATGTGSGKTECFLVPVLGSLYHEAHTRPESFKKPGVRALLLYPMNALVNDQLSRLRLLFGDAQVSSAFSALPAGRFPRFGMYTGRTPYAGPRSAAKDADRVRPLLEYYEALDPTLREQLKRMGRYPAKDLSAFLAQDQVRETTTKSGKNKGKPRTVHNWKRRLHTAAGDRELLTRHEMVHGAGSEPGHSPDILVTNYSMLEYMLMRPFERPIFEETASWLREEGAQLILVLDEAHMYRGAKGAEVAFLLRRLRARLGIEDRADKLRVIATSASLGSDAATLEHIRRFAADLSGKKPEDFHAITGRRESPSPALPGTEAEAEVFASVDLARLHNAQTSAQLAEAVAPVLERYRTKPLPVPSSDPALLAALKEALDGLPLVNQLVAQAAGDARALSALADKVFPGHPRRTQALQALLAVTTLAREAPEAPGLVPTRVHLMFRGLHGLYACVNPNCEGRQAQPGAPAPLGKLFHAPQACCDACGSRVFELASCRSCGAPYLVAYAQPAGRAPLSFLWGETEGQLEPLQLLLQPPRYPEFSEAIRLHLKTGYVDAGLAEGRDVRQLYMAVDEQGTRQTRFPRCAMCQGNPRQRSRIYDFETRGEPPFTALIEAQFAEQAPQKQGPALHNHGRKVLVFSDGRQKAARLAPALEHSHARDLFRQVLALAAQTLEDNMGSAQTPGMHALYPAVVWLCANRGYNLFPSPDEAEFHNQLQRARRASFQEVMRRGNQGEFQPTASYAKALFSELTDRYYSLPSLALGVVEESPSLKAHLKTFPDVGLNQEAAQTLFRAWLRLHLERRSFRAHGTQTKEQGEGWARPEGINPSKLNDLLPNRFQSYLELILKNPRAVEKLSHWFQALLRDQHALELEDDLYYLSPLSLTLRLRLSGAWLRCADCGRIHPETLDRLCPGCCGRLVDAEPAYLDARTGFYREQVRRAFDDSALEPFGLSAAEHTAQLTGGDTETAFNAVEEYELRFQDIDIDGKPPIDVLSCTTTMEVGIDIGALTGVALRNVPPHVANYQQRAGRAGRRGRSIASVVTYAHGTSHDAQFFANPADLISGQVRPPSVYIENQEVLRRHVNAYLLQRFFHTQVPTNQADKAYTLFESLGSVGDFLSGQHACSLSNFSRWLDANRSALREELSAWVPRHSFESSCDIPEAAKTIAEAQGSLLERLQAVLPIATQEDEDGLSKLEKESLQRQLQEPLLQTLIGRAILPRYAFPTDVVSFWVPKRKRYGTQAGPMEFSYAPQRDLQLALTEYAPGRSITIDKLRFQSAALFSPYETTPDKTLERRRPYTSCRACGFVLLDDASATPGRCACCGSHEVTHAEFITPAGFAPDINAEPETDRGQAISFTGSTERAQLETQNPDEWTAEHFEGRLRSWTGPRMLAVVNKGVDEGGFWLCPDCGRAEPAGARDGKLFKRGEPTPHPHPLVARGVCDGIPVGPYFLGHRFPTDALLLRLRVTDPVHLGEADAPGRLHRAARMALSSLVEALALAASQRLQIEEGELSGWWTPVLDSHGDEAQLYLYDLLPGGAGYARAVGDALTEVLQTTEALLAGCSCETSCYQCIRHYGNKHIHKSLDRRLALDLLRHIQTGAVPSLTESSALSALKGLSAYLQLRGVECRVDGAAVYLPERGLRISVHHPLVGAPGSERGECSVDSFTLVHDLPAAVSRLGLDV